MMRKRGIAFRLTAAVLSGAALVFLAVTATGYLHTRKMILASAENNARNLALRIAHQIETVLAQVEKQPDTYVAILETIPTSKNLLIEVLQGMLEANPQIFGVSAAFEPYTFNNADYYFNPYLFRNGQAFELKYLGENYHYFFQDWYQIPRETGKPSWSEPYFDEGAGNILMATYAIPFFRERQGIYRQSEGRRRFIGVATADISLEWLDKTLAATPIPKGGHGFILSRNGVFIVHPDKRRVMNETIFSIAEAQNAPELRRLGQRMIAGRSGIFPFTAGEAQKTGFLCFVPIAFSRWSLGIFVPEDELLAELNQLNRKVSFLFIGGLGLLALVVWLLAGTITRPLTTLSATARQMAKGDLAIKVPGLRSGSEVGVLADSLAYMQYALRTHIKELLDATAAKERIESELTIAREIQMSLVPGNFSSFTDMTGLDLHAVLRPAREVGGDLYDFQNLNDGRVLFVVGDVSGKGVPAAMFMAITMTLVRMTAAKGLGPGRILQQVNRQLCRDNEACMFVTVFCGILDTHTGELRYANGGHNPPLLVRKNSPPESLEDTGGGLLGIMDDLAFETKRITLKPGDGLFIFSDGVTEAEDTHGNFYSDERLADLLAGQRRNAAQSIEAVMKSVLKFAGSAPQADDITMLMVRLVKEAPIT